jgi:hypothetical protein
MPGGLYVGFPVQTVWPVLLTAVLIAGVRSWYLRAAGR